MCPQKIRRKTIIPSLGLFLATRLWKEEHENLISSLKADVNRGLYYNFHSNPLIGQTLVLAEDRSFWRHPGFSFRSMLRAMYVFLRYSKVQGASTIDQQLVRTVTGKYEKTVSRKIKEIIMAVAIQSDFSKFDLISLYIEKCYFGWRGNGIVQICNRLNINASSCTAEESALLASLVKLPLPKAPSPQYLEKIRRRKEYILGLYYKSLGVKL